jgi:hypothetical protein
MLGSMSVAASATEPYKILEGVPILIETDESESLSSIPVSLGGCTTPSFGMGAEASSESVTFDSSDGSKI